MLTAPSDDSRHTGQLDSFEREPTTKIVSLADGRVCTLYHTIWSPLSNYYECGFAVDVGGDAPLNFSSAKQYNVYSKAVDLGRDDLAAAILRENNPTKIAQLGSEIRGLDKERWDAINSSIMKRGLMAKFSQNESLRRMLFFTGDTVIAECSGKERIWGIGLRLDDPRARDSSKWKGKNKQGELLAEVRRELALDPRFADEAKEVRAKAEDYERHVGKFFFEGSRENVKAADVDEP